MPTTFLESDPAWRDPDDALRDLLERVDLIEAMQATEGWKLWADFLAAESIGFQRRLLSGRHTDMLDYRYDAGVVEGIRRALGAAESLRERASAARRSLADAGLLADSEETDETSPTAVRSDA